MARPISVRAAKGFGACLLSALLFLAAFGAETQAADLPNCPTGSDALEVNVPEYARADQGIEITLESGRPARLSDLVISTYSVATETELPILLTTNRLGIVVDPGSATPQFEIIANWTQDAGSLAACRGHVRYILAVIPPDATAGNPLLPRLLGRFSVRATGGRPGDHDARFWRFRPACAYFACDSTVRSTGGLKGRFQLLPDGRYELFKTFLPAGSCTVTTTRSNPFTGEVLSSKTRIIRKAFVPSQRIRIVVKKSRGANRVASFEGVLREAFLPTRRAERKGCTRGTGSAERFSGHLQGG